MTLPEPYYDEGGVTIYCGDSLEILPQLDAASLDAVVTDPPYELGFMGRDWDRSGIAYRVALWETIQVACKPGAHLLAFGGSRTYHRMACAIEDADWEIRDQLQWLYGSGFPKSHDVSKAIDKVAGAERKVVGTKPSDRPNRHGGRSGSLGGGVYTPALETLPATPEAQRWNGWGTALKPAHEPLVLARKPLIGRVVDNVLEHGTGAINVDGCRIRTNEIGKARSIEARADRENWRITGASTGSGATSPNGRWPPNVILDEDAAAVLDAQSGAGGTSRSFAVFPRTDADSVVEYDQNSQATGDAEWVSQDHQVSTPAASDTPQQRAITDLLSGTPKPNEDEPSLPMSSNGSGTTDLSPTDSRSTTSTETSKITDSKISSSSIPPHTSDCTANANSEMEHGGSPVVSAENSSPLPKSTGTSAEKDGHSTDDAAHATSQKSSTINVNVSGANRFLYVPKASTRERTLPNGNRSNHPTVKPLALMRWLLRLVTPPGGLVLDPFLGSGTTAIAARMEGFRIIGIEREPEYCELAVQRLSQQVLPLEGVA